MTVCIAVLFNWNYAAEGHPPLLKKAALLVSDRMITAGDVQYEPQQLKLSFMTETTMIAIAGDYSTHTEALTKTHRQMQSGASKAPDHIASIYGRAIQDIKHKQAEDLILSPLGMNAETFVVQQKEMSDSFIDRITTQLQNYEGADVEALVVGSDGQVAHIYLVDTNGIVHVMDDVGFAAIGIGAWHAKSRLMQAGYHNNVMLAPALATAYAAKKSAEIAPGVGVTTDIHILTKGGHFRLWDDVDGKARELYEGYRDAVNKLGNEAILELDKYITQQRPSENKQSQGQSAANPQTDVGANPPAPEAARGDEAGSDETESDGSAT